MIPRIEELTRDELRKILLEQQAVLDNVTVGILFSRNRTAVSCNALCAEIFGYRPEELVGTAGIDLYPSPEAYKEMAQRAGPILASGKPFHDEIQYRRKDGSTFWARTSAKAIDPAKPQDGTIWIMADITEERAVREALAQATHELEAVFETSLIGIAVFRKDKILRCNRRYAELLGHAPHELPGRSTRLMYPSDEDHAHDSAAFLSGIHNGNQHQHEQRLRRKDGSEFWARLSARAFDQAHPEEGSVWMIEDISDRKTAEEQVRGTLAQLELIFNNAAVGMMYVCNRIVSRCNRKFEEIFGYAEGELVGNSTLMLYPTLRDYDQDGAHVFETLRRGETASGERRFRRKDGRMVWVRATGHKTDTPGPSLDVIWIFEDVTERHAAEEALLQAHDEMEQRVIERTSELASTNEKLQEEIYERMQAEQRIWHVAHHDALTGLPNRSLLLDRLDQALVQADRSQHRLAMMFLDLDRFKSINDTLGHHVGDQLLKHVAKHLQESVRAVDTVSRLGGDEFVVVLHEIQSGDDARMVAEKILATLSATALHIDGNTLYATPSIGISVFPDDAADAFTLMKNADMAMYHAKANGRNTYQFFTSKMHDETNRIFSLEQRLRGALERNEFVLHYQPLVDYRQKLISGIEVLVRWQDPEHGFTTPSDFIPIAEEIGLILPLGEWVIREACRQNIEWQSQGYPALPISINLSARQFRQKDLVEMVGAILHETGMSPKLLELEISESSLMQDADETLEKFRQLDEMGISLSIDDFGTGYSSLAYLKRFTVHKLKIDKSFIHDLCNDKDDAAIVATIIAMARNLGLQTLAEGVETEEQLRMLLDFGCHQFQGYLFSRPHPPAEATSIFQLQDILFK